MIDRADDFYKFQPRPNLSDLGVKFSIRTPEQDWASDKAQTAGRGVGEPKTFFTTAADAAGVNKVSVSAGSMGPIMVPVTVLTVADGNVPALKVTFNTSGVITAAVPVANTAANTATIAYFPLANVAIVSGSTVVTPTAWNYSWAQTCGKDGSGNIIANPY